MEFNRLPEEYNRPPEESPIPPEIAMPAPEYPAMTPEVTALPEEFAELRPVSEENEKKPADRNLLRRLLRSAAVPVAAGVAAVSLFFAASGYDPLGNDVLNGSESEGFSLPKVVAADTPTPTPTETPTPEPTPALINLPDGSVAGAVNVTRYVMHADNEPDYHFTSSQCDTEQEALDEVRAWLKTWGGNPRFLPESSRNKSFLGYELSDDCEYTGSLSDPSSLQIQSGEIYAVYQEDIYCDAWLRSHGEGYCERGDATLPKLPNLDPDFEGKYAWNGVDPEQYIFLTLEGDSQNHYLEMGAVWGKPPYSQSLMDVPGATYNRITNTLTLNNCTAECINTNLMGNSFTIELIGENHIGYMIIWGACYAGSVTFTGDGFLTVNEDMSQAYGLVLEAEGSPSAILVERGADIEINGSTSAIFIEGTTLDHPICFLDDHTLLGGGVRHVESYTGNDGNTYYDAYVVTPDGDPATCVTFEPFD